MVCPASVLGSPLGGGVGDFVSSGIAAEGTNLRRRGRLRRTLTFNSLQTKCQSPTGAIRGSLSLRCLITFDQLADTQGVGLAMAMAGDRGGPSGGIDTDLRPDYPGGNLNRSDLSQGDALFAAAEQARLEPADVLRRDNDSHWKEEIASGPAAGGESFRVR
jgi:hypothetical protein